VCHYVFSFATFVARGFAAVFRGAAFFAAVFGFSSAFSAFGFAALFAPIASISIWDSRLR
jgi:hypothetical protein